MEKNTQQNIQDAFLNTLRREKTNVTIQLMNASNVSGRIKSFDKFSVIIDASNQDLLIFKHAISTISHPRRVGDNVSRSASTTNEAENRS